MSNYPVEASPACPLFDYGSAAAATRAAAHDAAKPKQTARQLAAIEALRLAGSRGLTRHELAEFMGLPLQSVCSPVLAILRSGLANEDGRKRATESGAQAAVITIGEGAK